MSRRVKIRTQEMGDVSLLLIGEADGVWESPWEALRRTEVAKQFTRISKDALDHALKGWSKPLVRALGIPPHGALRKLPMAMRACARRDACSLFDAKQCSTDARNMPWCFEPDGIRDESVARLVRQVIECWRSEVYLVVVNGG